MNNFKDFGIKPVINNFTGDKIKIERILNREIQIIDFKIQNSKYENAGEKCLHMQIQIGEIKHVVFTGSKILMQTIQQVSKDSFPFLTTVVKDNEYYEFT